MDLYQADLPSYCIWWSSFGSTFCGRRNGTLGKHRQKNQTHYLYSRYPQKGSASSSFSKSSQRTKTDWAGNGTAALAGMRRYSIYWVKKGQLVRRNVWSHRTTDPMRPVEDNPIRAQEGERTGCDLQRADSLRHCVHYAHFVVHGHVRSWDSLGRNGSCIINTNLLSKTRPKIAT